MTRQDHAAAHLPAAPGLSAPRPARDLAGQSASCAVPGETGHEEKQ